jgi:hypothetical protein
MPKRNTIEQSETIKKISSKYLFSATYKHIVILGQPGAGKTTLTKYICQEIITNAEFHPEIINVPFLLRLRDLNMRLSEKPDKNPIINSLFEILGLSLQLPVNEVKEEDILLAKERILIPILEELKCLIILDGYDEIADAKNKERIVEDFKRLILSLNQSKVLMTSRNGDFQLSLENVDVLEICPLSEEQIKEFVTKWLCDQSRINNFIHQLKESPFFDTAIRPLTLGHLCAIFERSGKIPDKPKTVYRKIVNLLLEEWDEQRGIKRISKYALFEIDRKFEFLCRLSYELTINYRMTIFSNNSLRSIYNQIFADFDLRKNESTKVITELETHTGLILQVGYEEFEFAHKSIQEFLCAEHLVKLPVIPEFKFIGFLPNELAIAVTISSSPSQYFVELVFNHFATKASDSFITNFVNRLVIEKPDFNTSKELCLALIVLYTLFKKPETGQLYLFNFDLPIQFEKFIALIFQRNKRFTISPYYDFDKVTTDDVDAVLQLRRKQGNISLGRYRLPEYVFVRKTFVTDFDDIG